MALLENLASAFPDVSPSQISQLVNAIQTQGLSTQQAADQLGITLPLSIAQQEEEFHAAAAAAIPEEEKAVIRQQAQADLIQERRTTTEAAALTQPAAGLTPAPIPDPHPVASG